MRFPCSSALALLAVLAVGCVELPAHQSAPDAAPPDARPGADARLPDAAPLADARPSDAAPSDAARDMTVPVDAAPGDMAPPDALPDAALPDSALPDAALPDAALPDAALPDAALPDDALPADAQPVDAAAPDAEPEVWPPLPEDCSGPPFPPYDATGRACGDLQTLALWHFERDLVALGTAHVAPRDLAALPPLAYPPQRWGSALQLRGEVGDRISLDSHVRAEAPFTVETWVRAYRTDGSLETIVGNLDYQRDVIRRGWELSLEDAGDGFQVMFRWAEAGPVAPHGATLKTAGEPLAFEEWYHVAVTVDRDARLTIYVDSQPVADGTAHFAADDALGLVIGNRTTTDAVFKGYLDELRISGVARRPDRLRPYFEP